MMNSKRLTVSLGACLAVVLTLVIVARPDPTRPNYEFLPEMVRSPAVKSFEVTPEFGNGRAQQPAVSGTIPRGLMPLHLTATKEDAIRAGEELQNPYRRLLIADPVPAAAAPPEPPASTATDPPLSPASTGGAQTSASPQGTPPDPQAELLDSIRRGEHLYGSYCLACHGAKGAGDGPVAQRGFPPPPPLPTGKSAQMQDGQLFHILTFGQGSMSPMAAQLDRNQRWDVINFVRSLQTAATATTSAPPAADAGAASPGTEPVQP